MIINTQRAKTKGIIFDRDEGSVIFFAIGAILCRELRMSEKSS